MAYTVLARRYRSQGFDDVIGQGAISQTLKNAIKTNKVAHAYLFSGTRGVGKTTMARILAKALNCLNTDEPTIEPCGKCDSCVAVNIGEDIDVIEIDGASNTGVDNIRELRQNAIYRPARARYKIYIIDEVHMLSTGAFNALLKILEEPPGHVKFIFATTEPNKVLATIQSRCQRFDFSSISAVEIAGQLKSVLKSEKIKFEDDLIMGLARMANGSMRDGLSLLDKLISTGAEVLKADMLEEFLGTPNIEKISNLVTEIAKADAAGTLTVTGDLIRTGLSEVGLVNSLTEYFRDLMIIKAAGVETDLLPISAKRRQQMGQLAEKFDITAMVYFITALEKLRWTIKNSDTAGAILDAAMLRFALNEKFINIDELIAMQKKGGVKKNLTAKSKPIERSVSQNDAPEAAPKQASLGNCDLAAVQNKWQQILGNFENSTAALLSLAKPGAFDNGVLTIEFGSGSETMMNMCQTNGRAEKIESVLKDTIGGLSKVKFALTKDEQKEAKKSASEKRNEILNHPAVKSVLTGLNAKVSDIEQ